MKTGWKKSAENTGLNRKNWPISWKSPGRPSAPWKTDDTILPSFWLLRSPAISTGILKIFLSTRRNQNERNKILLLAIGIILYFVFGILDSMPTFPATSVLEKTNQAT